MKEQQRIFLAVALCLGIMLLWPFIFPSKKAPPPAEPTKTEGQSTIVREGDKQPAESDDGAAAKTERVEAASDTAKPGEPSTVGANEGATDLPKVIPETTKPFETARIRGELSNKGGSLTMLEITEYNERLTEDEAEAKAEPQPVSLATAEIEGKKRQATVSWDLGPFDAPPLDWAVPESGKGFALRGDSTDIATSIDIVPREDVYAIDYHLSLENRSKRSVPVQAKVTLALNPVPKLESSFFSPPANQMHGICAMPGDIERRLDSELSEDGDWTAPTEALWGGIDRQYFVVALLPEKAHAAGCRMSVNKEGIVSVEIDFGHQSLAAGKEWQQDFVLFVGPKRGDALIAVSPALEEVIDYSIWGIPLGFMARPMVFLMSSFHGWTGSWGVAILLLTLVVKTLLFPVTYKSSISMRKMQLLKPELDKLKKQFDGDRERQQQEQMRLFKEKGVNPLGGCLPMLLQMPVWFALYRTLWTAVDLYQQPFLWLADLTAKEPFPLLALVLGGLMFVQQRLMPTSADSQQAKMMLYIMPVMFTVFMLALPSGLVLYILFNTILTIGQQLVINKRLTNLAPAEAQIVSSKVARQGGKKRAG